MKNAIQKTAVALVAMLVIVLVSGNALLAQEPVTGALISAADLAFIKAGPTGIHTQVASASPEPAGGFIPPADQRFIARPYTESNGVRQATADLERVGIITAADYRFLTAGQVDDLFSVYSDFADSLAERLAK